MTFTRTLIAAALIASGSAAFAQASINQNLALAGSATPGDTPGFPITINAPGSYKLTSNLFVPANTIGIEITAPNVTLDLNGFSIIGTGSCTRDPATMFVTCTGIQNQAKGVVVTSKGSGATVRRGLVKGFLVGVDINATAGIEDVEATQNNTGFLCYVSRILCRLSAVTAHVNQNYGIEVGTDAAASIERSNISLNGYHGLFSYSSTVSLFNVHASFNRVNGVSGPVSGHAVYANGNSNGQNFSTNFRSMGNNMNGSTAF